MNQTTALPAALPANGAFSPINPNLQLVWDSTSLGELKKCPRSYELAIVQGWQAQSKSHHLVFGSIYHSALEAYDRAKADGMSHDDAQLRATHVALQLSWGWTSEDPNKNRRTLVRSVVWYLEHFASDPMETVVLANGQAAVELTFKLDSGYDAASTGEPFMLSGHLDRVARMSGAAYVIDRKTSKHAIDQRFFDNFTPDNQFSLYALAGRSILPEPVVGLIVDGVQVAVGFSRYMRGMVLRSEDALTEWHRDLGAWLRVAEAYAVAGHWPMNDKACFGCQFRRICSKGPRAREVWMEDSFERRVWDPTVPRGVPA